MPLATTGALTKWKLTTRTQSSRADTFRQFILFAGAVGFGMAFAVSGVYRSYHSDVAQYIDGAINGQLEAIAYVRMLVYAILFLFGLSWGLNGLHELNLLQEWLKPERFVLKRRNLVHATTMLVGILLGVLFALTPDFRTLVYVFIFYTLIDLFLWKLRKDEIARLIDNSLKTLCRDLRTDDESSDFTYRQNVLNIFREGAELLRDYYLIRSHFGRVGVQLLGVVAIAVVPLAWKALFPSQTPKDFSPDGITIVGYLLFVWCLSISEVTVYIWRQDLDARLAALGEKLYDMGAA